MNFNELSEIKKGIIRYNEGPKLVLAGPGSGKTRVLTENIKFLLKDDTENFHVLALTFTNKAANEMKNRLVKYHHIMKRSYIGTIHSFCLKLLSEKGNKIGLSPPVILYDEKSTELIIKKILENDEQFARLLQASNIDEFIQNTASSISRIKRDRLDLDQIKSPLIKRLFLGYEKELENNNAIDYNDLLRKTIQLFKERPKIRNFYNRLYKYVFIDEGQDLNDLQYETITSLCTKSFKHIMIVGDPNQAIFRWNGADPKYLRKFRREFNAKNFSLNENYRNSRLIIELAKKLKPEEKYTSNFPVEGTVKLIKTIDEALEAQFVVKTILDLMIDSKRSFNDFAIITRTNFYLKKFEKIFKDNNIPYTFIENRKITFESEFMKIFEIIIRMYRNPMDKLYNQIFSDIEEYEIKQLVLNFVQNVFVTRKTYNFLKNIELLKSQIQLNNWYIEEKNIILKDLDNLKIIWRNFIKTSMQEDRSINNFLNFLALGEIYQYKDNSVALLTVHTSKGTEFDVVFIIGLLKGYFPHYKAETDNDYEEELNNIFVAVTRAKRHLYLSYPVYKTTRYGPREEDPSEYISKMGLENADEFIQHDQLI